MLLAPTGFDFMPPGVHTLVRVQENKVTVVDIRSQRIEESHQILVWVGGVSEEAFWGARIKQLNDSLE